jgi:Uma2 family endonuclease
MSLLQTDPVKPSIPAEPARQFQPFEKHRFTVEEYDALGELNLPPGKTELVHGEIVHMPPVGNAHAVTLDRLYRRLIPLFPEPWFIRTQSTHRMGEHLAREPDIAVLTGEPIIGAKLDEPPKLVVEISDTTLANDLGPKRLDYGNCGFPDYWVIDVQRKVVHVFRGPVVAATEAEQAYASHQIVEVTGVLTPLAAPAAQIRVADIMPKAAAT